MQYELKNLVRIIALIYCAVVLVILNYSASIPDSISSALFHIFVMVLVVSPQFYIHKLTRHYHSKSFLIPLLIFQATISALGIHGYYDITFIHPDAQGALVFLFLPLYQDIALLMLQGIFKSAQFISAKKTKNE